MKAPNPKTVKHPFSCLPSSGTSTITVVAQDWIIRRVSISNSNHHHCNHRLATMTTTISDNGHGDQDDIGEGQGGAQQPLQNHLGTENAESPMPFHLVAELRRPSDHHPPQEGAMTIDPSSPTASSFGYSTSQCSMSFLPLQHLDRLDPHELPDDLWTSPSSSSGGGPPEASDDQLDRFYDSHPRHHQQLVVSSSAPQTIHQSGGASSSGSASSGVPLATTIGQTSTALAIRPIGSAPSVPTTKSRGRTSQGASQLCPGHPSLFPTSSSPMTITQPTASAAAGSAHHQLCAELGEQHQPQPMEIDTSLSTGRPSSSSFISWQDSSSTEHQLSRYPGFWSQDGYQGFWGHPPPMPSQHRRDHPYGDRVDQHRQQQAATSCRDSETSHHLRGHRLPILQHQLGQDSKMEDIEPEYILTSSTWRHLGMSQLGHLQPPR